MSLDFHSSSLESSRHTSASLSEAVLDSSSFDRIRASLPEQYRAHLDELRKNIFAFCDEFGIPREALSNKETFRIELTSKKIPPARMVEAVSLFRRFEYLIVHKELFGETPSEYLEEAERLYNLYEQYTAQVELLKQMGILHPRREQLSGRGQRLANLFQFLLPFGKKKRPEQKETKEVLCITGIDGKEYPLPTLEEIATHLCEQRELFATKRDQGFTKLLLVPFGMSLDALCETFKQFLLSYKQSYPDFDLYTNQPLWAWGEGYSGADTGNPPKIVYNPKSFDKDHHKGRTKTQILKEQTVTPDSFPGWRIHLFQSPDPTDSHSPGFAPIPRQGQGTTHGKETPRPSLEAGKTPNDYLSILQEAQDDPTSPYHGESGLAPEDWILAFMTHLTETGEPLDDYVGDKESITYLTGYFFPSCAIDGSVFVLYAYWSRDNRQACLIGDGRPGHPNGSIGVRTSVIV